jgi:hypothetical protein
MYGCFRHIVDSTSRLVCDWITVKFHFICFVFCSNSLCTRVFSQNINSSSLNRHFNSKWNLLRCSDHWVHFFLINIVHLGNNQIVLISNIALFGQTFIMSILSINYWSIDFTLTQHKEYSRYSYNAFLKRSFFLHLDFKILHNNWTNAVIDYFCR